MSRSISFIALTLLCCAFALRSDAAEPAAGIPFDAEHTYALELPKGALTPRALTVAAWVKSENPAESQGILDIDLPSNCFSFYISDFVCPHCGRREARIPINDISGTLLSQLSRRLTSIEINLNDTESN